MRNREKEQYASRKKLRERRVRDRYVKSTSARHRGEKFGESNVKRRYFCCRLSVNFREIPSRCAAKERKRGREGERGDRRREPEEEKE